jgi:hypothetical protein
VKACFGRFLAAIGSDGNVSENVWKLLYPTNNIVAASVLALLSADRVVDISEAIARLAAGSADLEEAYLQYRQLHEENSNEPRSYNRWIEDLKSGVPEKYAAVRHDLEQVLGTVPD